MDAPLLGGELPAKAEAPRGAMDAPLLEDAVPAKAEAPRGILRPILKIAWPVMASALVQWSQSFFTIWLIGGNGSRTSMAAFGLSNVLCNVTGHSLLWGIGSGFDTLAPQAWGADERRKLGVTAQRVLAILVVAVCAPVVAVWLNASSILLAAGQDRRVALKVESFARIRVPGLFAQAPVCVITSTLTAMGKTRALLALNVLSVVASGGLNWLFISARSPLSGALSPVDGSALASTCVDIAGAFVLSLVVFCDGDCRDCWPGFDARRCFRGWGPYLALAVPSLVMVIIEWWSWDCVNLLAGLVRDPRTALAANALLGNVISLAYCLPFGLQAGTRTLVGNALGAQKPEEAKRAASVGAVLGVGAMGGQALALYAGRRVWSTLFEGERAVGDAVARLLKFVVFFAAGDGVQLVLSGIVTGAGKQKVTTPILFFNYWLLGLPLGAVFAFHFHEGLLGLWKGMCLAVWLHVVAYVAIAFSGRRLVSFAIDYPAAAAEAAARLEAERPPEGGNGT